MAEEESKLAKMVHRHPSPKQAVNILEVLKMQRSFSDGTRLTCAALLVMLLCGCAKVNDTGLRLVSTKTSAYLAVNGQWLEGDVLLVPDRSGRASFAAADSTPKAGISSCSGSLRYTATFAAEIDLHCNDGTHVVLQTTLISETRGYGYGATAKGPAQVAFGLSEADAYAFMGRAAPESPAQTP
jgi:hypothetical protein